MLHRFVADRVQPVGGVPSNLFGDPMGRGPIFGLGDRKWVGSPLMLVSFLWGNFAMTLPAKDSTAMVDGLVGYDAVEGVSILRPLVT